MFAPLMQLNVLLGTKSRAAVYLALTPKPSLSGTASRGSATLLDTDLQPDEFGVVFHESGETPASNFQVGPNCEL